ncbi:MAG: hypothetical protein CL944_00470 [Candidatus Diapherotrites archaeon]|uniref:Glycosyltransferase family 2 protein n=1 Tax=Candidatus Iainarchaeum sp. TaxID=3101447 RepID=A0A2D6LP25_9ARCH|nr:hypothetical protein [Candidatus Diapherotrites archaeon]|tara:strand:- start:4838 stop:5476 length:639 start_codon:yes stop_codon:yes gene_type:complete
MADKKNIAICIPSGRFVDFSFFKSFAQNIGNLMLTYNTAVFTVASPMIFENRNELMRRTFKFEETNPGFLFDYILWLDNDIVFNFKQIQKLISHLDSGKDFVSGVYFNPLDDGIRPVAYYANGERYKWLEESELNGFIEVDAVGFGFCAFKMDIARRAFEKFKPRPFDLRPLDDGSLVTEDQVFCERAKELGYKIFLDSELIVKHAKGYLPR